MPRLRAGHGRAAPASGSPCISHPVARPFSPGMPPVVGTPAAASRRRGRPARNEKARRADEQHLLFECPFKSCIRAEHAHHAWVHHAGVYAAAADGELACCLGCWVPCAAPAGALCAACRVCMLMHAPLQASGMGTGCACALRVCVTCIVERRASGR